MMRAMWWLLACRPPEPGRPVDRPAPEDSGAHSGASAHSAPAPTRPNVLLVVLDDLGADRLGVYGNALAHTPTLDRLAAEGRWFRNAWGYAVCSPARAATFTGRHALRTGYGENVNVFDYALDPAQVTVAEALGAAEPPYTSSFVGKWHLENALTVDFQGPTAHGWGWYAGSAKNIEDYFSWDKVQPDGSVAHVDTYATIDTTDDAIARLSAMPEPWLLTVAWNSPHGPYHAPPAELLEAPPGNGLVDLVNAMSESVDHELGRLLAALDPELRARTLVVVVGDNGDLLDGNQPGLLTGKVTMADGGVAVPFIVNGPGVGPPGPSDALVSLVDVFPTIAEAAGIDLAALPGVLHPDRPLALDGVSLGPVLEDPTVEVRPYLWSGRFSPAGRPPYAWADAAVRDHDHELWVDRDGVEHLYPYGAEGQLDEIRGRTPEEELVADQLRERLFAFIHDMEFDAASP